MAATVRVTKNFRPLGDLQFITREDMAALGQELILRIRQRTAAGVDAEQRPFAPYSPKYAEQKGATVFGAVASALRVNLELTGAMLGAMTVTDVTDTSVTLGFPR